MISERQELASVYAPMDIVFIKYIKKRNLELYHKGRTETNNAYRIVGIISISEKILFHVQKKYGLRKGRIRFSWKLVDKPKYRVHLANRFKKFLINERDDLIKLIKKEKYDRLMHFTEYLILEGEIEYNESKWYYKCRYDIRSIS